MLRRWGLAALLVGLTACGSPTAPSPYNQIVSGSVDVFGTNRHSLSIPQSGTMTLTLSWQDPGVDLDLYLTATSCTVLYPKSACNILQSSSASIGTSERITRTVANGESYNIFVDNLSVSSPQSYTLTITIQ